MQLESRNKLQIKNNIYKLSLLSFITVALWIGLEIYWSYQKTDPPSNLKNQIEPLNPNLDTELIYSLSSRTHVSLEDLSQLQQAYVQQLNSQPQPESSPKTSLKSSPSTNSGQLASPSPSSRP